MKKSIKFSVALCALLLPGMAMGADTWWNAGTVGNWEDAANWNAGVPTASDRAIINNVADQVTISAIGAVANDMILQGSLTIASAGELTTGALNANSAAGNATTIVVDGQVTHVGASWFQLGGSGGSTMTINPNAVVTSSGSEFIIGEGGAASLTVAGTFSRAGWLHLKDNSNITVSSGGLLDIGVVYTASGDTAGLTINGGVSTIGTLEWDNGGTGTLDMNGGQLTITGFLDTPANTYNIGDGELFFTGTDVATVDARVSGSNWYFADTKSVVDMGGGTIRVASVPLSEPTIVGSSVSNNLMKILVDAPSGGEHYYPVASSNLESAVWGHIPHSPDGLNPFVATNLSYSTTDGSNTVIYVRVDHAQKFFKVDGN